MKKSPKHQSKKKKQAVSPDAGLPAADQQIAKHKRIEAIENKALHKEIIRRVSKLRDRVEASGTEIIDMCNEARAIGFLVSEAWDKLPGKQMTLDFWHQQQGMYVDSRGRKISLEELKWMVKVSRECTAPLTKDNLRQALGMRQQLFLLADYHLEGEAPYLAAGGGAANDENYYTLIKVKTEKFTREFTSIRDHLVKDPKFGPLATWNAERKAQVWNKLEPLYKELDEFKRQLNPVEV